jgi:hypothetical protein
MRIMAAGIAERRPHRSRLEYLARPADSFRRGELTAALAAVAVATQVALAPVMLLVVGLLVITGRISRWRLAWLLLPAAGSACWLSVAGLPAAAHALAAGAGRLIAAELAAAVHPERLLHPAAAFSGSGRWLPRELPLLVLAGTAEAAIVLWLSREPGRGWRPGLVAAMRLRTAVAALAAGRTVTADGCAIGVDYRLGRLAAVSWAQAERGVMLTGSDPAGLGQLGLAIACAALRRRKAMLVLDLAGRGTGVAPQVALLAERIGVPVTDVDPVTWVSTAWMTGAVGRAIRSRSVLLLRARRPDRARAEVARSGVARSGVAQLELARLELAQRAVTDLVCALSSLRELGLRGDCLAWIIGCEAADVSSLRDLLTLGPVTGTAVVLSTTSAGLAADLAAVAALSVASGPIADGLAQCLADLAAGSGMPECIVADILQRQHPNSATIIAGGQASGPVRFRIVPIQIAGIR